MTARFCIRCTEPHSESGPLCNRCQYAEEPPARDEETTSTLTLAELRAMYGNPLRNGELGLTETQGDPMKRRRAA